MDRNAEFTGKSPPVANRPWGAFVAAGLLAVALTVPFTPWLSDSDIASMGASADTIPIVKILAPRAAVSVDTSSYLGHSDNETLALDAIGLTSPAHHTEQLAWAPQVSP